MTQDSYLIAKEQEERPWGHFDGETNGTPFLVFFPGSHAPEGHFKVPCVIVMSPCRKKIFYLEEEAEQRKERMEERNLLMPGISHTRMRELNKNTCG